MLLQLFCLFNRVYSRKEGAGDEKMKVLSDLIQFSVLMHLLDAIWVSWLGSLSGVLYGLLYG